MPFTASTVTPGSAGGMYCVSPTFGAATCHVTTQQKAAGMIFGVAVPGQFSAIPVATFLDGGVTPAWAGVNGSNDIDLITQVNAQIVIPGTTTPAVVNEVNVEAGLAANGILVLTCYDINGNLLGTQPFVFPPGFLGPHGRRQADIAAPGIAYIVVVTTNPADTFGVNQYELADITPIVSIAIACPVGSGTATVGVPFVSSAPVVTGGTPPDTFVLLSGPAWMTIDPSTGVVSGTPTYDGIVTYEIQVTDSLGNVSQVVAPCSLTVSNPIPPPPFCIVVPATPQENLVLANEPLENQGT